MSAELLRRAATLMREDVVKVRRPYGRDERFASAVADWLDYQARTADHNVSEGARKPGMHPAHPAFKVARAYLNEPDTT